MKVLLVPHVGETVGHFVRCVTIAEELEGLGISVVIAASATWRSLYPGQTSRSVVDLAWPFSHNLLPDTGMDGVVQGAKGLARVIEAVGPDLDVLRT